MLYHAALICKARILVLFSQFWHNQLVLIQLFDMLCNITNCLTRQLRISATIIPWLIRCILCLVKYVQQDVNFVKPISPSLHSVVCITLLMAINMQSSANFVKNDVRQSDSMTALFCHYSNTVQVSQSNHKH